MSDGGGVDMRGPTRWTQALLLLVVAGCASTPAPTTIPPVSLAAGEFALPEVQWVVGGQEYACAGTGYAGGVSLHGSATDPALTWVLFEDRGERETVVWPHGYRARFTPRLEVLDETGRVIAREGDQATGGCRMPPGGLLIELATPAP